jgi:heme O synthase-like polyprenyltransferase
MAYSVKLVIDRSEKTAWTLFKMSSPYLAIVFAVLVINFWV